KCPVRDPSAAVPRGEVSMQALGARETTGKPRLIAVASHQDRNAPGLRCSAGLLNNELGLGNLIAETNKCWWRPACSKTSGGDHVWLIAKVGHVGDRQPKARDLGRVAVVVLEAPGGRYFQARTTPRNAATIDLLCNVAEEGQRAIPRN